MDRGKANYEVILRGYLHLFCISCSLHLGGIYDQAKDRSNVGLLGIALSSVILSSDRLDQTTSQMYIVSYPCTIRWFGGRLNSPDGTSDPPGFSTAK